MSNFTHQIHSDGHALQFIFDRIQTINGPKYFVTVADPTREYHFVIERSGGDWMLNDAPKVPQWIHDLETKLIEAIAQHEKTQQ